MMTETSCLLQRSRAQSGDNHYLLDMWNGTSEADVEMSSIVAGQLQLSDFCYLHYNLP